MSLQPRPAGRGAAQARTGGGDPPRSRRSRARSGQQPDPSRLGVPRPQRKPAAITLVDEALAMRRRRCRPTIRTSPKRCTSAAGWRSAREQEGFYRQAIAILPDTAAAVERRVTMLLALATNLRRQGRLEEAVTARAKRSQPPSERSDPSISHRCRDDPRRRSRYRHRTGSRRRRAALSPRPGAAHAAIRREQHSPGARAEQPGGLLGERGYDESERHFRRALAISQSATGPEHPASPTRCATGRRARPAGSPDGSGNAGARSAGPADAHWVRGIRP